jgi:hypothetical protein
MALQEVGGAKWKEAGSQGTGEYVLEGDVGLVFFSFPALK